MFNLQLIGFGLCLFYNEDVHVKSLSRTEPEPSL